MKLPWTKNMHQVQCAICTKVKGKENLLVLKLDSLFKHVGMCKAKVSKARVEFGSFYFDLKSQHA
jgi:hypothetical protein